MEKGAEIRGGGEFHLTLQQWEKLSALPRLVHRIFENVSAEIEFQFKYVVE